MLFYYGDPSHFLWTTAGVETVKELWFIYHAYRYDIDFSFVKFLKENGLDVSVVSPQTNPFGYSIADIEISLN